ncbi:ATP phosphoribosyltransferase [Deltaproteobacteria bacterium OttesenSCG-928-K17]|nr:ATP phosphoribosyltransferase [Deltaproteobacteria bacterium OttesenSCG-928-K17]
MDNKIKLGIPKGSLERSTLDLFAKAGWRINVSTRNYFPDIDDPEISCSLAKAKEMAHYVADGTLDVGLTGKDWCLEYDSNVVVVDDFLYSKASYRPARWVLAVSGDSPCQNPRDLAGKRVATELVNVTKKWFAERDIPVEVVFSWGATEAKVVAGLADAVVEVTETGSTIKAHGLKIISEVMQTNTQLIANPAAWEDEFKRNKIKQVALLLKGALKAYGLVGLKLNVRERDAQAVIELLPSLNAPTVAHLYQTDWLSVETVISDQVVRDLIPRLMERGAEGIIEYPLNKVL